MTMPSPEPPAEGFCMQGGHMRQDIEIPPSGLVDTALAARIVGVEPVTIRGWKNRGHLEAATDVDGRPLLSEQGLQLFEVIDVIDVEYKLRKHARRTAPSYA